MYEIEIFRENEFYSLDNFWNSLLIKSNNKNIFSLHCWQKNYWKYFRRGLSLFILICKRKGEIVGILPLTLDRTKTIQFLGSGVSDYLDIICLKGEEKEIVKAYFNFLISNSKIWNFIKLENIPEDSYLLKCNIEADKFSMIVTPVEACPYICLPESYEEYLKSLGKKTRFNLNYYRRAIMKKFKVEFKVVSEGEELEAQISLFFELHKKRWRKKGLPGVLYTSRRRAFHQDVAKDFFKKDILRLYTLSLDGEIVAILYGFVYFDKFYYYLSGFNPEFSKYSVGTIITSYAIEKAIEGKVKEFDFLRGEENYKYRFNCKNKFSYNLYIVKKEAKSLVLDKIEKIQKKLEKFVKKAIR